MTTSKMNLCLLIIFIIIMLISFKNLRKRANDTSISSILDVISSVTEVSYKEYGYYPKIFEKMGFNPCSFKEIVIKYKSNGSSFTASAVHKKSGYALSIGSDGRKIKGDILREYPEEIICKDK